MQRAVLWVKLHYGFNMSTNTPVLYWKAHAAKYRTLRLSQVHRGLCAFLFLILAGCEGDTSVLPEGFEANTDPDNQSPVADAGPDANGRVGALTVLDGSRSSDPDGDVLLMQWSIESSPAGSQAQILNANDPVASLTPDVVGTYVVSLGVTDGGLTAQDRLTLEAFAEEVALANAGPDQAVTRN